MLMSVCTLHDLFTAECFTQSSPGLPAYLTNCSGSTHYCVTYLHNYGNGYRETTKGCASANECQMSLTNAESGQCSVYSEDQLYTSDFKCTYCCTKDKCNGRIVPPHETMYTGHVTLPTTTNTTTTECLVKPSSSSPEVTQDCSGSTPYCITHYTNYNNGYRETTKGCASKATCDATKSGNKKYNDQCTYFDENFLYKSDFTCSYCCTKDICNTGILPPHETLYQP
ncbi:uncharacterized protein [Mytilus edulis]|uniref:uncharacterized protein n=1 Tax=Mytilus edulis TaxID=6550 RepID=UPI0039EEC8E7